MTVLVDPEFWARLGGIVVIDLTLAGDNALVIALAVRTLPPRQQLWGRVWGTAGAVALRLLFIALASMLLKVPLLPLVGGLALVVIAVKLVCQDDAGEETARAGASLWDAIWVIIVADAVMSLDNILAVAGVAHGDMLLATFGVGLSLPIVVWGSGLLSSLMGRFPSIVWLGGGILGYVGGEMMVADGMVARFLNGWDALEVAFPAALGVAVLALALAVSLRRKRRVAVMTETGSGGRPSPTAGP